MDICARYPGSVHDSRIYQRSSVYLRFRQNEFPGLLLLGDSGYACSNTLLTPFLNPATAAEERYNRAHITTRNTIERINGVWKRRFPCLSMGLRTKLQTSLSIICAVAVLHNIAVKNDNFELEEDLVNEDFNQNAIGGGEVPFGLAFRRAFANRYF